MLSQELVITTLWRLLVIHVLIQFFDRKPRNTVYRQYIAAYIIAHHILVNDSNVNALISSLQKVRAVYLSGHINQPILRKFLAVCTPERMHLRVPLRMRTFYEHEVLDITPDSPQRSNFRTSYSGLPDLHQPLKLQLLAKHQNLRVFSVH